MFKNDYTDIYQEGESAEYTDTVLNKTFTNSDVLGQPKVQALTAEVIKYVYNTSAVNDNLASIPNKASKFSITILGSARGANHIKVNENGWFGQLANKCGGIRPVVTLKSGIQFLKSAEKINDTTTWEMYE